MLPAKSQRGFRFSANDKIRFEEDYSVLSVYSIDIEGTAWCAGGPQWHNMSATFAAFGSDGINDATGLSDAGWTKTATTTINHALYSVER